MSFLSAAGHYVLNLSLPLHVALASRLKDAAATAPEGNSWINLLYDTYRWETGTEGSWGRGGKGGCHVSGRHGTFTWQGLYGSRELRGHGGGQGGLPCDWRA
jgi:hypothetical protein